MDLYERIKELAAKQKISITALEEKLKIANGTIRRWGNINPGVDKVQKVADYFGVTVDFLLGREENKQDKPTIEGIIDSIENFSGEPLNDSDREWWRMILEAKEKSVKK